MALNLYDRVKETTTTVGTGSVTLLGATTGFQSFAVVGNANTTYYCIADQGGANWEVGIGTYTASGTTLARTTVLSSSNAGSLVTFTAGVKDVFVTYPSSKGLWKDASGNAIGLGTPAAFVATNVTGLPLSTGVTGTLPVANGGTGVTTSTGTGSTVLSASPTFTGTVNTDNLAYTGTLTGGTGVVAIGTNQIYKDASGNVGIGTSSPTQTAANRTVLSVNGTTTAIINLNAGGVNKSYLYFDGTNTSLNTTTGLLSLQTDTASAIAFNTNGATERMRIDSSGNVGIGTSSPSTKLTVAGAITITGAFALRGSYGGGAISSNFAAGDGALAANTTGASNTASGRYVLLSNTTGLDNTAIGASALQNNTTGTENTAIGSAALTGNTTGAYNTAIGRWALLSNTTGASNTAIGENSLLYNTTGTENTASGVAALISNTTGIQNTAVGSQALLSNTTGASNTASGVAALYNNTTGSGNSAFNPLNSAGAYTPVFNPTTQNNRFCMGSTGVTNAYIQVAWTVVSDARDKTNFAPVPHGLDFVNQLQPTAYQFKEDRKTDVARGIVRYGFKAQDVLALEGDTPVIIDTEDLDKLRFNESSLIPVLVNAIKELTARLQILEAK